MDAWKNLSYCMAVAPIYNVSIEMYTLSNILSYYHSTVFCNFMDMWYTYVAYRETGVLLG